MVQLQVLNKVLCTGSMAIILDFHLNKDYFPEYESEYNFITDYWKKYACVPSQETMLDKFPDFQLLDVRDSAEYLIETIREEYQFNMALPVLKKASEILKDNSIEAIKYLMGKLPDLALTTTNGATDIVGQANIRGEMFNERATAPTKSSIMSGLEKVDKALGGWMKGEELVTLFARTGEGKTWLLVYMMVHAWAQGYTVGIYSGEMTAEKIGYRFDTIYKHYSNSQLIRGTIPKLQEYLNYIDELTKCGKKPFYVITPKDLGGRATVSQLEQFINNYHLDILGIDQYSLMKDEKSSRYSDTREQLEHISADLFDLSCKKKIPIIALSQASRAGAKQEGEKGTPDLETIYGADAIAQNSTKVISFRQTAMGIEIGIKKNRDGKRGDKFVYSWDYDTGVLTYIPDANNPDDAPELSNTVTQYNDKDEGVF